MKDKEICADLGLSVFICVHLWLEG